MDDGTTVLDVNNSFICEICFWGALLIPPEIRTTRTTDDEDDARKQRKRVCVWGGIQLWEFFLCLCVCVGGNLRG